AAPSATRRSGPRPSSGQASLWELEQRFRAHGLDPMAAYDKRVLQAPWLVHSRAWIDSAAAALAHCIVSATAFLDLDAVVLDGACAPELLQALCEGARRSLADYNWEGLHQPPRLELGSIGSDARALGGALLPLHACFAPDHEIFLKA
ncbi:ROK family transcriptional regulator, partial [Acidovorax sp. NPDC077664]